VERPVRGLCKVHEIDIGNILNDRSGLSGTHDLH
jgi:hypothetical protein